MATVFANNSQDWKPVIWKKPIEKKMLPKVTVLANKQKNQNTIQNTTKKVFIDGDNNPDIMPIIVDKEFSIALQQARLAKKISQQELSNKLSIPLSIINSYEKGTGIRNGSYITKIKKYLDIKI